MKLKSNRRVLLVNPPQDLRQVMGGAGKFVSQWEPLGLLYLASNLLKHGYDVKVIDAEADPHTVDQLMFAVEAYDPAIVGITCLTPTAPPSIQLGQRIKNEHPERVVVMGNVHAREFPEVLLRLGCCDFIVHGDGEFIFLELIRCLEAGDDPGKVAGISFLEDHRHYVRTNAPPLPRDLDQIPPPARHLLKDTVYDAGMINNMTYIRPQGTVSKHALGSRGCVFECSFCVVHQERRFRSHSAKRVVDEMVDLVENYNCGYLFFIDPLFVGTKSHVYEVCNEIIRRGVNLPWGCEGHVRMVDREMLQLMKRAGCKNIAYGIESGSQRILKLVGKGTQVEHIKASVKLTHELGIAASGLFILGLPTETREEMEQTMDLAASLPLDLAQYSMFVPYPGSHDYQKLVDANMIDNGVRPDGSVDLNVWRRYSPYVGYGSLGSSIYLPPGFTFDELFAMQRKALRKFFLRPRQIWDNLKRLRPNNVVDAAVAASTLFFKQAEEPERVPMQNLQSVALPKYPKESPERASSPRLRVVA